MKKKPSFKDLTFDKDGTYGFPNVTVNYLLTGGMVDPMAEIESERRQLNAEQREIDRQNRRAAWGTAISMLGTAAGAAAGIPGVGSAVGKFFNSDSEDPAALGKGILEGVGGASALGGQFMSLFAENGGHIRGTYSKTGLLELNGDSHDEASGGIDMTEPGSDIQTLVEGGETVFNDFVYTNSRNVEKGSAKQYKLPKFIEGLTFADASKKLAEDYNMNINNANSKKSFEQMMGRLEELHMATVPESRPENQAPAAINNAVQGAASFKFGGDYKVLAYAKGGDFEHGGHTKKTSSPELAIIQNEFLKSAYGPNARVRLNPEIATQFENAMKLYAGYKGENDPTEVTLGDTYVPSGYKQKRYEEYLRNKAMFEEQGYYINQSGQRVNSEPPKQAGTKSFHTHGKAIDLAQGNYGMQDNANLYRALYESGFRQHPGEWWHWSIGEFDDPKERPAYLPPLPPPEQPQALGSEFGALQEKMINEAVMPSSSTSVAPTYPKMMKYGGNLNSSDQETPLVVGSAEPTQTKSFALGGSLYEKLSNSQKKHFNSMYNQFIKDGYSEEMALVATSVGFKESNFKLKSENSYLGTSNNRLRNEIFDKNKFYTDVPAAGIKKGDRFKNLTDEQLNILKQSDEFFFNAVYGGREGNGPFESGDGYRYRGRGLNQLTQKNMYKAVSKTLFGDENVLVDNPDLVLSDEYAGAVAAAYYSSQDVGNPLSKLFESVGLSKDQIGLTSDQLDLAMDVAYAKTAGLGESTITSPNFKEKLKNRRLYADAIAKMKDFVSNPEETIASIQGNQTPTEPTQPTPTTPEPAPAGQVPEYSETGEALNRAAELELLDYLNKVNELGFDVTQESIRVLNEEDRALIDELFRINQEGSGYTPPQSAVPDAISGEIPQKELKIPDVVDRLPQQLSEVPIKNLDDLESIVNQLPNEAQVLPSVEDLTTDPPTSPTVDPTTSPVINQLSPEVPEKQLSPEQVKRAEQIKELLSKTLNVPGVEFKGTSTPSNLDLAWQQASGSGVPFKDASQQSAIANQLAPESSDPDPTKSARAQAVRSAGTMPTPKPSYEGGVPYKQSRSIIAGRTAEEEVGTGDPSEDLRNFQSLIGSSSAMDNVPNRAVKVDFTEREPYTNKEREALTAAFRSVGALPPKSSYKLTDKDREALTGAFRSVGALPPVPGEQEPPSDGGLDSTMKTGNFLRMMPIITSGAQALAAAADRPTPTPIGKFDIKTTDKAETLNVDPLIAKAEEAGATARQVLTSSLSDPGQAMAALTTLASNLGKQKSDIAMQKQVFDTTQEDQLAKSQLAADSRNQESRMRTAFANQADRAAYTDNLNQAFSAFSENLAGLGEEQRNREIIKLISPFDEQGRPIPEKLGYASQLNQLASMFGLKLTKSEDD